MGDSAVDPQVAAADDSFADGLVEQLTRGRLSQAVALIEQAWQYAHATASSSETSEGKARLACARSTALTLHELGMDEETVAAALLHGALGEDTGRYSDLPERFGPQVARLVHDTAALARVRRHQIPGAPDKALAPAGSDPGQAERLRRLLLALVDDLRVVLIVLAECLYELGLHADSTDPRQRQLAEDTLAVYAPLAGRLGVWRIKWRLEDFAFRVLEPDAYRTLAAQLRERRGRRERYVSKVMRQLYGRLARAQIAAKVSGRPKHLYSIWRKMRAKDCDLKQLFDIRAVRVMVDTVEQCYAALGVVHTLWTHVPEEFDDYIAKPKPNGYRSLHTAVSGPGGKTIEVQIRSREMHRHAELGVAAHWRYKEGGTDGKKAPDRVALARQVLHWQRGPEDAGDFAERLQNEVFHDRVYLLTPQGRVVELAKGAKPLDFAYAVHSGLGHRCRGAKVDGRIVPLDYTLETGQQVEILATPNGTPSRDWLNPRLGYLHTARAKAKVRRWFRQQDYDKHLSAGRELYDAELKRLGIGAPNVSRLLARFNVRRHDDFLALVGRGEITPARLTTALREDVEAPQEEPIIVRRPAKTSGPAVAIDGVAGLLTSIAGCCKPLPPEPIIGYVTRGRGVSIHLRDCRDLRRLAGGDNSRLLDVTWRDEPGSHYRAAVVVSADDRQGLLRDLSGAITNEKVNIRGVTSHTNSDSGMATVSLRLEVRDLKQLDRVLAQLRAVPGVLSVRREAQ